MEGRILTRKESQEVIGQNAIEKGERAWRELTDSDWNETIQPNLTAQDAKSYAAGIEEGRKQERERIIGILEEFECQPERLRNWRVMINTPEFKVTHK